MSAKAPGWQLALVWLAIGALSAAVYAAVGWLIWRVIA